MSYIIEVKCTNCGKLHNKVLPNKSSAVELIESGKKKTFCERKCKQTYLHNQRESKHCVRCNKETKRSPSESYKFCSRKCYTEDCKEFPEKYGLLKKAENMRRKTDKVSATEKMVETKIKRELAIDWKDSNWKPWYRKCNAILLKKRKELVGDWDGYDYIDGKYIKDNLNLDYRSKYYPTLDHVIPKQKLYLEGLSPHEACSNENLRWTTRSNNSRKGIKEV